MKLYFYSSKTNINSYFVVNEDVAVEDEFVRKKQENESIIPSCKKSLAKKEGILLDPTRINEHFIEKIENEGVILKLVLLTNAGYSQILHGVNSLQKIYNFEVFSINSMNQTKCIHSSIHKAKNFQIEAYPIKMNGNCICMYKIGASLFTGLPFLDGFSNSSPLSFLEKIERERLNTFLFTLDESTVCFPLSGPPFTIKTFKFYMNN